MSSAPTDDSGPANAPRFDETHAPVVPGRTLIEASAGTGKTFALVALFIRLVLEGRPADRLLVVTFTVAATEELTRRIREGLRAARAVFAGMPCPQPGLADLMHGFEARFAATDAERRRSRKRLQDALAASSDLAVFTIHGFCKHALEEWAFESGTAFHIDFTEEADDLLRRAAADCWHHRVVSHPLLAETAAALEWNVEEMLDHLDKTERHPGTEVVPAIELADALDELRDALDRLRQAWDEDELRTRFAPFVWNKSAPFTASDLPRYVRKAARGAEGRLVMGLEAICAFASEALRGHANKRQTDRDLLDELCAHAGPQACTAVVHAVERLEHAFVRWFAAEAPRRFRALKQRQHVLTFDDLLTDLLHALEDPARGDRLSEAIRARYELALVDEFQDTDPRQYTIFKNIFSAAEGERPVFLIGDAKQAIYRFRGADLYTYLDARREVRQRFTLGKNWRSDTRLVKAVNAVFAQAPTPFLHDDIPFQPVEAAGQPDEAPLAGDGKAPFVWWHLPPEEKKKGRLKTVSKGRAEARVIEATAGEIAQILGGGMTVDGRTLRASDIAVLVRYNAQAEKMQAALQQLGVPAVVSATRSILETREMADVETFLQAVLEPRPDRIRAALATELWGCTAREIYDLKEDAARWAARVRQFERWQHDWQTHGVAYLLTRFLDEEGVRPRLLAYENGERRLTNVRHCVELLHEAEQRRQQAPSGLLRWLARREEEARLLESDDTELRLESDERAVQVLTLHKSKGLEFGVVFCPFLWDARARSQKAPPLVRKDDGVVYDLGSEDLEHHRTLAQAETLAEDLRLTYVGLTRAVHRCYVVWGDVNAAERSALGYLLYAGAADVKQAETPVERAEAVRKVAKKAQADTRRPDRLRELFGTHEHIQIEHFEAIEEREGEAAASPAGEEAAASLQARTCEADLAARLTPWTYASYSAWTREAYGSVEVPIARAEEEETEPEDFVAFAAGRRAGRCLHEILEHVDFAAAPEAAANVRWVRRLLRRHRLDAPEHHRSAIDPERVVLGMLDTLRTVALPQASFTFADVERKARANEWFFSLPMAQAGPRGLHAAFADAEGGFAQAYASRVADLDAGTADGFLRGTVDLLIEKDGRYYLVDWKSNLLADEADGYDEAALKAAMLDHHYVLQYHLYAAALQRHLARRLPDYDYRQHFGGVWYVFLRGLQQGERTGLFFDRPREALLSAINRHLDGGQ